MHCVKSPLSRQERHAASALHARLLTAGMSLHTSPELQLEEARVHMGISGPNSRSHIGCPLNVAPTGGAEDQVGLTELLYGAWRQDTLPANTLSLSPCSPLQAAVCDALHFSFPTGPCPRSSLHPLLFGLLQRPVCLLLTTDSGSSCLRASHHGAA